VKANELFSSIIVAVLKALAEKALRFIDSFKSGFFLHNLINRKEIII